MSFIHQRNAQSSITHTHTHTLQDLYNSFAVKASAFLTFKRGLTPGWIVDIYILYLYFWFSSLEQTEFQ